MLCKYKNNDIFITTYFLTILPPSLCFRRPSDSSSFAVSVGMDVAALRERLAAAEQSHVLDFWDDLSEDERKALYEDAAGLDLAELNEDFERMSVKAESDAAGGKMDDHMQPLPADQCGSVLKATEEVSADCVTRFANGLGYLLLLSL